MNTTNCLWWPNRRTYLFISTNLFVIILSYKYRISFLDLTALKISWYRVGTDVQTFKVSCVQFTLKVTFIPNFSMSNRSENIVVTRNWFTPIDWSNGSVSCVFLGNFETARYKRYVDVSYNQLHLLTGFLKGHSSSGMYFLLLLILGRKFVQKC